MQIAIAQLESLSPYGQGRKHNEPKLMDKNGNPTETADAYEKRTWRGRMHVNPTGHLYIPPMAFKNCLSEAARYLGEQIPGKGKKTYTKRFESGILVVDPLVLPIKAADVPGLWLSVPSDGRRGGGRRVDKCFPVIQQWAGEAKFIILDELITADVFERHLKAAGSFIGIGFFRPANNGFYGRFKVAKLSVRKYEVE